MARLVLGPLLRYTDGTSATVWVETDAACIVEVLGHHARTFCVAGHHYAVVVVTGLEPATSTAYDVRLDGDLAWPEPEWGWPPSTIRTSRPEEEVRVAFGSCRVTAPRGRRENRRPVWRPRALGVDALAALAVRMRDTPEEATGTWPDVLLLVGDQVYADQPSPGVAAWIRERRGVHHGPGDGVADFEEYTRLYREAWSDPAVRWLLSTVPSAMVFDDHDVHDDWNTSQTWRQTIQRTGWWHDRIVGGLASYWIYQHLGNLDPAALAREELLGRLQSVDDGWPLLEEFAEAADAEADGAKGYRWSYRRDVGRTRLVVVDSRCGRILEGGSREMVSGPEWDWIVEQCRTEGPGGPVDHLLVATSLPLFLPAAIHHLEAWNEAICQGARGPRAARLGEVLRQAADLEHWAAFGDSFRAMTGLLADVGAGRLGPAPVSISVLSGDVHYAYVAEARFPQDREVRSRVYQVVCSPLRNPVQRVIQLVDRFARTRTGRRVGEALSRSVGLPPLGVAWDMVDGPWFDNHLATVVLRGEEAQLVLESAWTPDGESECLRPVLDRRLAGGEVGAEAVAGTR
jgi:hypothetical protein